MKAIDIQRMNLNNNHFGVRFSGHGSSFIPEKPLCNLIKEEAEKQALEWELKADTIGGLAEIVDYFDFSAKGRIWIYAHYQTKKPIQFDAFEWFGKTKFLDVFLNTSPNEVDIQALPIETGFDAELEFDNGDEGIKLVGIKLL